MTRFFSFLLKSPEDYGESYGSYAGIWFEGAILIIIVILLLYLYRMYRITRIRMTLNLFLGFLFYMFGIIFSWIAKWYFWKYKFYVQANLVNYYQENNYFMLLIYTFRLPMIMLIVGNYFLAIFFASLFSENSTQPTLNKNLIIRKSIEITIIAISLIPAMLYPSTGLNSITISLSFSIMLLDSFFFIPNSFKSFKSSRLKAFGRKYINIGIMALLMFNLGIMFLCDRITMILGMKGFFNEDGYTIFYFSGWISVIVALITAIYGFVKR